MLQDGEMIDANELHQSICLVLPDADPLHSIPDLPALLEEEVEGDEDSRTKQAPPLPVKRSTMVRRKTGCEVKVTNLCNV